MHKKKNSKKANKPVAFTAQVEGGTWQCCIKGNMMIFVSLFVTQKETHTETRSP